MATIKELPGGVFRVQWYDSTGVRHRKNLPKKEADQLYKQVIAEQVFESTGTVSALSAKAQNYKKLKFCDLANEYLNKHLLLHTRAESNKYYVQILIRKWGEYRLPLLNLSSFREWIWHALDNPIETPKGDKWILTQLSASSVEKIIRYFTAIFFYAVEEELIHENPFKRIKNRALKKEFRRRKTYRPEVLSVEEFWAMVESFPDYVKNPAVCCFFSGVRRGELGSIRWSKIDRKQRRIEFDADSTKEAYSKYVYYDKELDEVLEKLAVEREINSMTGTGANSDFVFFGKNGTPLSEHSFTSSIRYYCDAYAEKTGNDKFRKITPHTFRRSYRTRKDREGADRKAVAANMGHKSLATSEIYNVMDAERQKSVAGSFNDDTERIREQINALIEAAWSAGLELSEVQTALRIEWRLHQKKMPS